MRIDSDLKTCRQLKRKVLKQNKSFKWLSQKIKNISDVISGDSKIIVVDAG